MSGGFIEANSVRMSPEINRLNHERLGNLRYFLRIKSIWRILPAPYGLAPDAHAFCEIIIRNVERHHPLIQEDRTTRPSMGLTRPFPHDFGRFCHDGNSNAASKCRPLPCWQQNA